MHLLVKSRSAFIKRNRKGVVLPFIITAPGGKDGPAITEQIQHGVLFRHPQGLVAGQDTVAGARRMRLVFAAKWERKTAGVGRQPKKPK
jgi:hypothetical protein